MTTRIIENQVKQINIDFSKRQLLKSINTENIILATGEHCGDVFSGVVIRPATPDVSNTIGSYSNEWYKVNFTICETPLIVEFNN